MKQNTNHRPIKEKVSEGELKNVAKMNVSLDIVRYCLGGALIATIAAAIYGYLADNAKKNSNKN